MFLLYMGPPFGLQSCWVTEWSTKSRADLTHSFLLGSSGSMHLRDDVWLSWESVAHHMAITAWLTGMHGSEDVEWWNDMNFRNQWDRSLANMRLNPTCASRCPLLHRIAQLTVANERALRVLTLSKHADVGIQVTLIHIWKMHFLVTAVHRSNSKATF